MFRKSERETPNAATGWTNNPPNAPDTGTYIAYHVNSGTSALTFNGTTAASQWAT